MGKQHHWEYFRYGPEHPPPPASILVAARCHTRYGCRRAARLGHWTADGARILDHGQRLLGAYRFRPRIDHRFGQAFQATRRPRIDFVRMVLLEIVAASLAADTTWLLAS
jgi:hypothetical protein